MGNFKGFDPNGFMLLEMNKFNDSRDFYESVKEDIKRMSIIPMRQLCSDLSDELLRIDPKMNLIPTKMVSRVRRDTRYSKNKQRRVLSSRRAGLSDSKRTNSTKEKQETFSRRNKQSYP